MTEQHDLEGGVSAAEIRARAGRGALLLGGRSLAIRALGLLSNVALARLLVPSELGVVAFGLAFIGVASFLADAGVGAALIRKPEVEAGDLQAVLGFQLLVSVATGALATAILLAAGSHAGVTGVMAISLPLVALRAPGAVLLERDLSYGPLVVVELVSTLSYYAWAVVTVAAGAGVWGLATAVVVRAAAGSSAMLALVPGGRVRPELDWPRTRGLIRFGLSFQALGLVGLLRDQAINLGTASISGVKALGLWTFSLGLLQVPLLVFDALWKVSYPAMARLLHAGDDPGPELQRALTVVAAAAGLLIVGMVGTAPAAVPVVFGPVWRPAVAVLPWAGLGLAFAGPVSVVSAGYLYARGDARLVLTAVGVASATWVAVGLALLPTLGVRSLGIGILANAVVESLLFRRGLARWVSIDLVRSLLPSTLSVAVAAALGWTVASSLGENTISVVASGAVGAIAYGSAISVLDRAAATSAVRLVRRVARTRP